MPGPEDENIPDERLRPRSRQSAEDTCDKRDWRTVPKVMIVTGSAIGLAAMTIEAGANYIEGQQDAKAAAAEVPGLVQDLVTPGSKVEFYHGTVRVSEGQLLNAPAAHAQPVDPASIDIRPHGEVVILNPTVIQGPDGTYLMGLAGGNSQPEHPQAAAVTGVFIAVPEKPPVSQATTQGLQMSGHNELRVQAQAPEGDQISVATVEQG